MTLPVPDLDDRRFQDLVDDAKRYVQQRCPEWSDHNVSDPGVTLIETFAMVTDQLLYRLNRVPDRLYIRFLELLGIELVPPAPACADVTFWLSAPRQDTLTVRAGAEVASQRTETDDAVAFETVTDLDIVACSLAAVATATPNAEAVDRTEQLELEGGFACFGAQPQVGDALLVGLSAAVPRCVVTVRVQCRAEGAGVDPRHPPLIWEAWTGKRWAPCELDTGADGTGGFNKPGDVVLHVPAEHAPSTVAGRPGGWLRCRLIAPASHQPFYQKPPRIQALSAFTVGGTIGAVHAETVRDEIVGLSEGVPGQRFALGRGPVLGGDIPVSVEVADHGGQGWAAWERVGNFDESGETDRHYRLDAATGEIVFGPAVRYRDGSVRRFGAVPAKAAPVRASVYRVGGGRGGNVAAGAIRALRTSVPYVNRVQNRRAATGGVDGEDVAAARDRAPAFLRTRERAVTVADHEYLARAADPRVARAHCLAGDGAEIAVIRLAVVPAISGDPGGPAELAAFLPGAGLLARVAEDLDARRVLGTRIIVEPPFYQRITAAARVRRGPNADPERVQRDALSTLYRFLHPLVGGPDGAGWPFSRTVAAGELLAALGRLPGVELVEEVRLYRYDPRTGTRSEGWVTRVELGRGALPFSVDHTVEVVGA